MWKIKGEWTVKSKGLSLHSWPLPSDHDLGVIFDTNDRSAKLTTLHFLDGIGWSYCFESGFWMKLIESQIEILNKAYSYFELSE